MQTLRRILSKPIVAIVVIGALAAWLRFFNLDFPENRIFDEVYYSKAGCLYIGRSWRECDVLDDGEKYWAERYGDVGSWVHPPLGKWAIGLGELVFGTNALGWRVMAAVFGTLSVMGCAAIAHLLWRSVAWTYVTGLLLSLELLNFVQSRTSMLDIFLTGWIVAGFLLLLLDRRWTQRRTERDRRAGWDPDARRHADRESETAPIAGGGGEAQLEASERLGEPRDSGEVRVASPILRPWRLAAGIAFGAAVATKWSGVTAIFGALLLSLMWERTRRTRAGTDHPLRGAIREESFALVVSLLLVPFAVYYVSYIGYFVRYGWSFTQWGDLQNAMFTYHHDLRSTKPNGQPIHPYLSHAWQWLLMARPVVYYYKDLGNVRREIIGMGNPAIFWASIVAVPYLGLAWRRFRDWRAGFVLVAILAQYLPWLIVPRPQFFFYMTPITPFLVLAVVYGLRRLEAVRVHDESEEGPTRRARPWMPVVLVYLVIVVAMFVWFWPVLTGWPLSEAAWKLRIWFNGSPWSAFNWV